MGDLERLFGSGIGKEVMKDYMGSEGFIFGLFFTIIGFNLVVVFFIISVNIRFFYIVFI